MTKKTKKKKTKKQTTNEKTKPEGYTFGRPTKYRVAYCNQLISHMKEGLSFESFAGFIGVTRSVIYNWTEKHPDFKDAQSAGKAACCYWWETLGRAGTGGQLSRVAKIIKHPDGREETIMEKAQFSAAAWIFNMKNRCGWRDRTEITGAGGGPIRIRDVADLTDDEIDKELAALEEKGV